MLCYCCPIFIPTGDDLVESPTTFLAGDGAVYPFALEPIGKNRGRLREEENSVGVGDDSCVGTGEGVGVLIGVGVGVATVPGAAQRIKRRAAG